MMHYGDEGYDEELREARLDAAERERASRCMCGSLRDSHTCPGPDRRPHSGADDHDDGDDGFGEFED
jgi:hypothetical protein